MEETSQRSISVITCTPIVMQPSNLLRLVFVSQHGRHTDGCVHVWSWPACCDSIARVLHTLAYLPSAATPGISSYILSNHPCRHVCATRVDGSMRCLSVSIENCMQTPQQHCANWLESVSSGGIRSCQQFFHYDVLCINSSPLLSM